jgi:hypothetical protein
MIEISDHALLRYMERVLGFDVKAMKEALAEKVTCLYPNGIPKDKHKRSLNGVEYTLENRILITVYNTKGQKQPKAQ